MMLFHKAFIKPLLTHLTNAPSAFLCCCKRLCWSSSEFAAAIPSADHCGTTQGAKGKGNVLQGSNSETA